MIKTTLTIGLFDKDTEKQEVTTEHAANIISDILINKYDIFAFTMINCNGVYKMNSSNRLVFEPSIRVEIATENNISRLINNAIEDLKKALNQESIMLEISEANIYFK